MKPFLFCLAFFAAASSASAAEPTWYVTNLDRLDCMTISGQYGSGVDTPAQYIDLIYHGRVKPVEETGASGAPSVRVPDPKFGYTDVYFSQSYEDCRAEIPRMGAERRQWAESTGLMNPNFRYQFRGESRLQ